MLTPVGKRIIIQILEVKHATLLLPNQKPSLFKVIAIGDEVTKVKENNIIYVEKYHGIEITHDDEKYFVIDESNILAKLD